jgi:membrane-associated phospholipid phosphatase
VILISGLIMSSRVQLKAHTLSQVFAGYILGIFFTFAFPFLF